jgi:parallel beta-helix repeat protein
MEKSCRRGSLFEERSAPWQVGLAICILACYLVLPVTAEDVTGCTAIQTPGTYVLKNSIMGSTSPVCISITSSDVVLDGRGYTIDGVDAASSKGVVIGGSSSTVRNVTVRNLRVSDWNIGIYASRVALTRIDACTATSNAGGIYLATSSEGTLTGNAVSETTNAGIYIKGGSRDTVTNNNLQNCGSDGIILISSQYETVTGNTLERNNVGVYTTLSDSALVRDNTFQYNTYAGISVNNGMNNQIYNNYFNNAYNVRVYNQSSLWNTAKQSGRNIIGGPYLGGNYWAQPDGQGFSQKTADANGDGICDLPFTSIPGVADMLPLGGVQTSSAASFTASTTSGSAPLTVQFTDTSTGTPTAWNWNFGDGIWYNTTDASQKTVSHTYTSAGTYTARLTVCNAAGCSTTNPGTAITVTTSSSTQPPVASFTSNITKGTAPLSVKFKDQSTNAASWNWNFGDGTSYYTTVAAQKDPIHPYVNPGQYVAQLTVCNSAGCSSASKTFTVKPSSGVQMPAASFTTSTTSGSAPLAVQFTDTSLGTPTAWNWNFGDGIWYNTTDASQATVTHTYASVGTYIARLTVCNAAGCSTTDPGIAITVTSSSTQPPVASFTSNITKGPAPLSVKFKDQSTNAASWAWTFGDGASFYTTVEAEKNPIHTYVNPGQYVARLTVCNSAGCSSASKTFTVKPPAVLTASYTTSVSVEPTTTAVSTISGMNESREAELTPVSSGTNDVPLNPTPVPPDSGSNIVTEPTIAPEPVDYSPEVPEDDDTQSHGKHLGNVKGKDPSSPL